MWRSIGSATLLALIIAGCGSSGGDSPTAISTSSPPPPPAFAVGGTVTGLAGSGLQLAICHVLNKRVERCESTKDIQANGRFDLYSGAPFSSIGYYVSIRQQPASPVQHCLLANRAIDNQSTGNTAVQVTCASFLYVTNAGDNTLTSYVINPTSGALTVTGPPTATGTSPQAIVGFEYFPYTHFETSRALVVGNAGSNDASVFAVNNSTGALFIKSTVAFGAGMSPRAMAISSSGRLEVAYAGKDSIAVYREGNGLSVLGPGSLPAPATAATGIGPASIVDTNSRIYIANHGGSTDISAFSVNYVNSLDGTYTYSLDTLPGAPFPAGGNPLSLALGAGGTFLYSANPDAANSGISGFSFDSTTGALIPLNGSPFPLPVSNYIASDLTGTYLYVTSGANIVGYRIDSTTGFLTALPGFPLAVGANAYSIAIDPSNRFLYVVDDIAAQINGFNLDTATGALTRMAGSPFPTGSRPQFIAMF